MKNVITLNVLKSVFIALLLCYTSMTFALRDTTSLNDHVTYAKSTMVTAGDIGGFNVYYGSLHNHCTVSDGTGTIATAYAYARDNGGLDFFGLSDHASMIDASEWSDIKTIANSYNMDGVFTAFWGFEWSHSTQGHVTIINTDDYCDKNSITSFTELLTWMSSRDCAAFLNHPGRQDQGDEFGHFTDLPLDNVVGMELWNKADGFDVYYYNDGYYSGDAGLGYFDEGLVRDWKLGAGGAEDNHTGDWGTRTDNRLAILADNLTRADLYSAIQQRRYFTTLDKNIKMSFKVNGSEMGSTITGNIGQDLQILLSDDDGENFTTVELLMNGQVVSTWTPNTSDVNIADFINTSDNDFYYIKVTQADGDEAISSPIFINGGLTNLSPLCSVTSPDNGTHYDNPQMISLIADASDPDGSVSQVEFLVNNLPVGTDNNSPWSFDWTIPANGSYSISVIASDNLGFSTTSSTVSITVGAFAESVSSQIGTSLDDAEEAEDGRMYTTSSDIELVYDTYSDNFNQTVGLRFNNLNIPQGVLITNAYIQFTVDEAKNNAGSLIIYGHNIDDSPQFTTTSLDISSRAKTSVSVEWIPPSWDLVGEAGADQQTSDLSPIIQEIVNRTGFTQMSSISVIITGTGTRTAEAYDGVPSSAAVLYIDYTTQPGVNNPPAANFTADATCLNVSFVDASSDSDGTVVSWYWEFGDGNTSGIENPSHTYASAGDYSVSLTVTDDEGATDTEIITVTTIPLTTYYRDNDGDTFGDANNTIEACGSAPTGYVSDNTDCDDNEASTYPGANEICGDGVDNDCDNEIDEDGCLDYFSVSSQISSSTDDAEEAEDGRMYTTSSDIELVYDTYSDNFNQTVGLRFNNLNIPQGVLITNAYIQFTVDETKNNAGSLTIYGHNIDDSPQFTTSSLDISSRAKTSLYVEWIPPSWDLAGEAGADQQTSDLSPIIQEIVNRTGFTQMSSISVIITGTGTRTAEAYDGVPSSSAVLHIDYTTQPGVNNPPAANFASSATCLDVSFVDTSSDSDGTVVSWYWDFGDGNTSELENPSHTYASAGDYSVSLTVTDNEGATDTGSITVNTIPLTTYYRDNDGDTYGDANNTIEACGSAPTGYVSDNTDCNDNEATAFPGNMEICDDGIDNNCDGNIDEGCIDCTYETINMYGFEEDFTDPNVIWNDGGVDAKRSELNPNTGNWSGELIDNTSASVFTTDNLNLANYDDLTVSFSYYPVSMDNSKEDFWLQISTDGGTNFTTLAEWNRDDEFVNGVRYNEQVDIAGPFSVETQIRFRCDASGNWDYIYLDDIVIAGCLPNGMNRNPVAQFTYSADCLEVSFNDLSYDDDGTVDSWLWDFGDGNTSTEQLPEHTFATGGTYSVSLTVFDDDGGQNSISESVDTGQTFAFYQDSDGDTYGNPYIIIEDCIQPAGYVLDNTDCDDNNAEINPGAIEVCDGYDNNCDGLTDEGCGGCIYEEINSENFEGGMGIWQDGGSDCAWVAKYPNSGSYTVEIRDNTSSSVVTTSSLDLSAYEELTIDFSYYPYSMDNSNEDFWLQISTDDGSNFTTVEDWIAKIDFQNGNRYYDQVVINGPFSSNTKIRFRCDASGNKDWIYIDDIVISGCLTLGSSSKTANNEIFISQLEEDDVLSLNVYPNPFRDEINISIKGDQGDNTAMVRIVDITGKTMYRGEYQNQETITIRGLPLAIGTYFVIVQSGSFIESAQLIKTRN